MNRRDRERWIETAKDQLLANEKITDRTVKELFLLYDEAAYKTENELRALLSRYASDNGMTMAEARRMLKGSEYSSWKHSIEDYLKKAGNADSKVLLELNTLAMKGQATRLEQLLGNMYMNMGELAGGADATLTAALGDLLQSNYYRSCFNIQQGVGYGFNVARINEKLLRQILEYPWDTKTFSQSLWGKSDKIALVLRRELTMGFIDGSSVQQMAKQINDVFHSGRYAAERLVRTESKYFANQGELMGYKENGIKKYRFVGGTEGSHSCACADLNGQVFNVDEAVVGVNYPPIHPNCLCIVVAEFERSMFDRREDVVPLESNTKFGEWKAQFTD